MATQQRRLNNTILGRILSFFCFIIPVVLPVCIILVRVRFGQLPPTLHSMIVSLVATYSLAYVLIDFAGSILIVWRSSTFRVRISRVIEAWVFLLMGLAVGLLLLRGAITGISEIFKTGSLAKLALNELLDSVSTQMQHISKSIVISLINWTEVFVPFLYILLIILLIISFVVLGRSTSLQDSVTCFLVLTCSHPFFLTGYYGSGGTFVSIGLLTLLTFCIPFTYFGIKLLYNYSTFIKRAESLLLAASIFCLIGLKFLKIGLELLFGIP